MDVAANGQRGNGVIGGSTDKGHDERFRREDENVSKVTTRHQKLERQAELDPP